MNHMVHGTDIVAYTYNADTYCPDCIRDMFYNGVRLVMTDPENAGTEETLDLAARVRGIDRYDEHSYDSEYFPKVVFASQIEDVEHCGNCHEEI